MLSFIAIAPWLLAVAFADYTSFFFSGNNTCPGLGISCEAPESLCAYDGVVDKYYCCSGLRYNVCRAFAATCTGRNNGPASSQQECNTGGTTWCCLQDSESCTQRNGQTNVCIATQANPLAPVGDKLLNETFSSLSSASPSASTFSVDVVSLASRATAMRDTSSASSATIPASATSSAINDTSDSISPGTIAGAVVGGVAGIVAIIALTWFLLRRRRNRMHRATSLSNTSTTKDEQSNFDGPVYTQLGTDARQHETAEVDGSRGGWSEMAGEGNGLLGGAKEMPDNSTRATATELPG